MHPVQDVRHAPVQDSNQVALSLTVMMMMDLTMLI